jgi:putative FmdB family regulatory protein
MPIYQYECLQCKTKEEVFKPGSEYNRGEYCPKCNAIMKRVFTVPGVSGETVVGKKI